MELQHAVERRVGIGEAAEIAGLSRDTIRRAADAGKLPHSRTPGGQRRFRVSDVEALNDSSGAAPASPSASVPSARAASEVSA